MPNKKVLKAKKAEVDKLTQRLNEATAGVFVDYKGINVAQDNEMRTQLRQKDVQYSVIKNTLANFAFDKVGFSEISDILNGTTALCTGVGDPILPIRMMSEYSKKFGEIFNIKAGFMEGKILPLEEITKIAELPSKDALYSKVLGTMLAPISSLAVVLGQILAQKGGAAEAAE